MNIKTKHFINSKIEKEKKLPKRTSDIKYKIKESEC
jgi:hypothetical protein